MAAPMARDRAEMRLNNFAIDTLRGLVETHDIDCQWGARGKYHAAVEDKGQRDLDGFRRSLDRLGATYRDLDATALSAEIGTGYYREAIHTPGCVLIQPAALARGNWALACPETCACSRTRRSPKSTMAPRFRCARRTGGIRAKNLLLTNNGFASQFGFQRGRLIPIMTFGSLSRPLNAAEQAALGGQFDWGVIPADHLGTTLRYTQDRRLLVRHTVTYAPQFHWTAAGLARVREHHKRAFRARFPMLPEVTLDHSWGGVLTMSRKRPRLALDGSPTTSPPRSVKNGVGIAQGDLFGNAAGRLRGQALLRSC